MNRVYNFAPGPSTMPQQVLETAAREMLCYGESGMNVMEMRIGGIRLQKSK